MSKTSQELKAKKAKKLAVEETVVVQTESRKAETEVKEVETSETPVEETTNVTVSAEGGSTSGGKKAARVRGKKYKAVKKKIDVLKLYSLKEAVGLVKETSISKFDGKVEAHLTVLDIGNLGEIVFPHLETSTKRIAVLNDTILAEIKEGKINFDILIATTTTMPKLLPFARVLGPKGLMPNPKSGTLTDKPEEAVKKLSVAKTMIRTEKKAPIVHIVVGKVSQPEKELAANIEQLIKVIKVPKIKKLALCATMGPCVKVEVVK